MKRSAREDWRNWLEKRAAAAEKAATKGRNYSRNCSALPSQKTEEWQRQEVGVKAKKGVLRTETGERLQRWVEHFSEILNRDDPTNPVKEAKIVESEEIEEIDKERSR